MRKHRAKGWFPDALERMLTTASGFLLNNRKNKFHTEHADSLWAVAASQGHLLATLIFLFNENVGKYSSVCILLRNYTTKTVLSTRFQEAGTVGIFNNVKIGGPTRSRHWASTHKCILLKHKSINTPKSNLFAGDTLTQEVSSQFQPYIVLFHALSLPMVHLFPSQSTSLPLGGPPAPAFTLWDALVCRTASATSAFLLPFPPPLAGERAERRI